MGEALYHLELRHFPRNLCRFNLSSAELSAAVLEPWVADRAFELGEVRWDPRHARLTVLEGPRLRPAEMTMGRGWRAAQRRGRDVTAQLLAAARQRAAPGAGAAASKADRAAVEPNRGQPGRSGGDLAADSLGLQLLAQMGAEPIPLRRVWELAASRENGPVGDALASDALALAERAVASLLRARLAVLLRAESTDPPQPESAQPDRRSVSEQDTVAALRAITSWTGDRPDTQVWLRRA